MSITIPLDKQVYLFELDDVLYPKKDYVLQIYYLFASFYEFTEGTITANELALFMKKVYDHHGESAVFLAAQQVFGIDEKYKENLDRLMANGQIPLRLEIYPQIENLIHNLLTNGKDIAILTKGNPVEQLNKLKFVSWGSVDSVKDTLKVYFVDELRFQNIDPIAYIAEVYNVGSTDIYYHEK